MIYGNALRCGQVDEQQQRQNHFDFDFDFDFFGVGLIKHNQCKFKTVYCASA